MLIGFEYMSNCWCAVRGCPQAEGCCSQRSVVDSECREGREASVRLDAAIETSCRSSLQLTWFMAATKVPAVRSLLRYRAILPVVYCDRWTSE